jgi:uncharacterized protein
MSASAEAPVGMPIDAATRAAVAELCRRYRVARLDIFGSAVREDFDPARSDVDLLVTFEPDSGVGLFDYVAFAEALEALFGRRVDLVSSRKLRNPYLRQQVEAERRPLFAVP